MSTIRLSDLLDNSYVGFTGSQGVGFTGSQGETGFTGSAGEGTGAGEDEYARTLAYLGL